MTAPYMGQPMRFGAIPNGPVQYGSITPGNNLIGTSLLPGQSPDTGQARQDVSQSLNGVLNSPDRNALAQQTFQQLSAQTEPDYQAALRSAGQLGAGAGQLGSGMLNERLTSDPFGSSGLGIERQKYLGNLGQELATQSAGQTLQDRLNQLSAGQGVLGQFAGLDQQQLGDVVGERGYEQGLSNQAFDQNMAQNQFLASLGGFGQATPGQLYGMGGDQGGLGGQLLGQILQNQRPQNYNYGTATQLSGDPSGLGSNLG